MLLMVPLLLLSLWLRLCVDGAVRVCVTAVVGVTTDADADVADVVSVIPVALGIGV